MSPLVPWTGCDVLFSGVVPRGCVLMNARDWEDAFTFRPTRTDYERKKMLDMSLLLEKEFGR